MYTSENLPKGSSYVSAARISIPGCVSTPTSPAVGISTVNQSTSDMNASNAILKCYNDVLI